MSVLSIMIIFLQMLLQISLFIKDFLRTYKQGARQCPDSIHDCQVFDQ